MQILDEHLIQIREDNTMTCSSCGTVGVLQFCSMCKQVAQAAMDKERLQLRKTSVSDRMQCFGHDVAE